MLNIALADKKAELTTLEERLKKGREEEGENKEEAKPEGADGAEGTKPPTKEMVEGLEAQNRKLHASFDGFKKEIAQLKE